MSREATSTRKATSRLSSITSPSTSKTPDAFPTADCNIRNRNSKPGTVNACLEEILYLPYHYDLTAWTAHIFVALFAMATFVHVVQAVISKRWFLLATFVVAGICETIGWAGRWWSASTTLWEPTRGGYFQSELGAYVMQAITLCIGPCFLNLGWYLLLTRLIKWLGPQFCRFTPTLAGLALTGSTVVALGLQGAGAGVFSFSEKTATQDLGSYVMLAGLALQILAMLVYLEVFIELVWRAKKNRAATPFPRSRNVTAKESASHDDVKNVKKWLIATAVSFGLVFVRTCYRIVVLASGSQGVLAKNEALFSLLDGALIFLSLLVYNFIHPLWFFPPDSPEEEETAKVGRGDESWFDLTPFADKTMQSPHNKTPASKW